MQTSTSSEKVSSKSPVGSVTPNKTTTKDSRLQFEFEIAGLPYKIKSSHDEKTVKELVQFVENRVQQALAVTKSGSLQSAAVLAALNIAEELILLKRQALKEIEILEEKALKLVESIDSSKIPTNGKSV